VVVGALSLLSLCGWSPRFSDGTQEQGAVGPDLLLLPASARGLPRQAGLPRGGLGTSRGTSGRDSARHHWGRWRDEEEGEEDSGPDLLPQVGKGLPVAEGGSDPLGAEGAYQYPGGTGLASRSSALLEEPGAAMTEGTLPGGLPRGAGSSRKGEEQLLRPQSDPTTGGLSLSVVGDEGDDEMDPDLDEPGGRALSRGKDRGYSFLEVPKEEE
jgi:hypothetical protein